MSTLRVDTIQNASGTDSPINVPGTAKAWVNFNGTGTVAIRASYNVSSITDNGATDYTVNFTTAITDANYVVTATSGGASNSGFNRTAEDLTARTTSAVRFYTGADAPQVNVAIFR